MIRNYFLITIRHLMKNKLFIFINIVGMSVAIGCCIVAYFNYEFDITFDNHHINSASVYRISSIREFNGMSTLHGYAPTPLGEVLRENVPDMNKVVRYHYSHSNFKREIDVFPSRLAYVDPEFFSVFTFELIAGKSENLKRKSNVFLSEEAAIKLFGTIEVLGKTLTQVYGTTMKELEIGGVFKKQPSNSSFSEEAYMNFDNYFDEFTTAKDNAWKDRSTIFVQVNDPSRLKAVHDQLQPYRQNNNKVREDFIIKEFVLDPFTRMANRDSAKRIDSWTRKASPGASVIGPTVMAILILLIACFNLTNTAIAVSSRRLKEIGIRKVMGSLRSQLIVQFICETTFICFIALLIGLSLGEILLAAWNTLWENMKLTSHYLDNPSFLIFLIGVLLFTGILAGSYPAFYISRFEPVAVLKGKLKFGGTNNFTRILLTLQYAISLIAIVSAIAFVQNAWYQRDFDLGFNDKRVIVAYVNNENEFQTYRDLISQNPNVVSIAGSAHSIYSGRYNDPVKHESKQVEVDIIDVGDDYLITLGLSLVEGRDFIKDSETDRKESVLITQKMADSFGWEKPLGKEIIWMDTVKLYVIGVIKNVYTQGLWREMKPMMIRYTSPDKYSHFIVSAAVGRVTDINKFMEEKWKEIFPNRLYNGWMMNEAMGEATTVNDNIVKMFIFFGVVAMVMSATGLFTLVSLNIIKKMKEIGVRKILGASIVSITGIINIEFIAILIIASLVGSYASYMSVDLLMDSIWDYYQHTNLITFIIAITLLFVTSALTVGFKVYGAASINPVNTLRDE